MHVVQGAMSPERIVSPCLDEFFSLLVFEKLAA